MRWKGEKVYPGNVDVYIPHDLDRITVYMIRFVLITDHAPALMEMFGLSCRTSRQTSL